MDWPSDSRFHHSSQRSPSERTTTNPAELLTIDAGPALPATKCSLISIRNDYFDLVGAASRSRIMDHLETIRIFVKVADVLELQPHRVSTSPRPQPSRRDASSR